MDPVTALALALYALAAIAHLALVWRARNAASRRGLARDVALVQGGLLIAVLALATPLAYWSGVYLWVKAIQDVLLAFIAPALIVTGRPWLALRQLIPGRRRAASEDRAPELETRWSRVGPVLAVVVFNAAWFGWHLSGAVDLVETNAAVRVAEQACYLGAGLWFWFQVAGPQGNGRWQAPLQRLAFVVATVVCGTVVGMALVFGAHVDYPAYQNSAHHIMTVLDDQQLSGAVLWMGNLPSLVTAGVALLNAWLNQEESAPAHPGLLFRSRTTGWPARPRIR
jgi:putative membrane protein